MLGTKLTSLATGVESFSFAFLAGWSIDQLVSPLASLADSVLKWKSVSIPAKIGEKLKDLASGINDFGLSFLAGWSLGTVTGPLGDLADSINKWIWL